MKSTLAIFSHLVSDLPPLISDDYKYQIRKELKSKQESETNFKEIEKVMVQCGYKIWPWKQAFKEFIKQCEDSVGEHFFLSRIKENLQKKYSEYSKLGMTWRDIYNGNAANYFSEDDRIYLAEALVGMKLDLKDFASREVVGVKKQLYLNKIEEYQVILDRIKKNIDQLRALADGEINHPTLANEIKARVEAFEHGLCLLAPEFKHTEVEEAHEFFVGRRNELNRLRGINEPVEVDFYAE